MSITRLVADADLPDPCVGLHFFNPVPMMALVEIIRGLATSDKTAALAAEFVKRIGKTALDAEDAPGFIVNRILCPMINEAIRSEEHTSELQSLMRISYAVFCLKKKKTYNKTTQSITIKTAL